MMQIVSPQKSTNDHLFDALKILGDPKTLKARVKELAEATMKHDVARKRYGEALAIANTLDSAKVYNQKAKDAFDKLVIQHDQSIKEQTAQIKARELSINRREGALHIAIKDRTLADAAANKTLSDGMRRLDRLASELEKRRASINTQQAQLHKRETELDARAARIKAAID